MRLNYKTQEIVRLLTMHYIKRLHQNIEYIQFNHRYRKSLIPHKNIEVIQGVTYSKYNNIVDIQMIYYNSNYLEALKSKTIIYPNIDNSIGWQVKTPTDQIITARPCLKVIREITQFENPKIGSLVYSLDKNHTHIGRIDDIDHETTELIIDSKRYRRDDVIIYETAQ